MHHPVHPTTPAPIAEMHETVKNLLIARFGEAIMSSQVDYDYPVFVIEKSAVVDVLAFLQKDDQLKFGYLTTMCGVHFPEQEGQEFSLVYHLHNLEKNWRIRLKTFMGTKDLEMPTITHLYPSANWMEREAFDFYGFKFKGHPDLRRILNMDEMNYHPLRKEYPLEDAGRDDKEDKYFGR